MLCDGSVERKRIGRAGMNRREHAEEGKHGSIGYRLLHAAAQNGHLEAVTWLVKEAQANVHAQNIHGDMSHHLAAFEGCASVLDSRGGGARRHRIHTVLQDGLT